MNDYGINMKADKLPISMTDCSEEVKDDINIYGGMSVENQMAILSHYLHNRDLFSGNKPEIFNSIRAFLVGKEIKQDVDITDLETKVKLCEPSEHFYGSFFDDFFNVPFPAPENPVFTFIDLFAGIGGFRIALQNTGGRCIYSSEWNTQARKTYLANFGEMPFGDITEENTKKYIPERFDVLCAGFPCQPFSISGKQKGFEDTRGTLFFDVCQIVQEHQPKVVYLENVKHLMHHDGGKTLQTILSKLRELGYNVSWKIMNGSDFGVPQNRERIIIIGSKEKEFDFDAVRSQKRADLKLKDVLDHEGEFDYLDPSEYTLLEKTHRQPVSGLIFAGYRNKSIRKAGVRPGTEHLSRVHKQPNRIYSAEGIHPTLPSQENSGRFFILTEGGVRKLTISECWRLMGFPEEYVKVSAIGQQYRQLGNSVCVKMIEAIAIEIKKQLLGIND